MVQNIAALTATLDDMLRTNQKQSQPLWLNQLSLAVALACVSCASGVVHSQNLPSGAQVSGGAGVVTQTSATSLLIKQTTDRLAINWQSFNIGSGNSVHFDQPSASSIALNRVIGNSRSEIFGSLTSTGQVFLVNPNGMLFGSTAQVDVGGLVASTLNITDRNFLDGRFIFSDASNRSSVINQGAISANNNGTLTLIGHQVINQGSMQAHLGSVVLGAGNTALLTLADNRLLKFEITQNALNALADNGGLIRANGGQVILTAGAKESLLQSTVNNSGIVEAQTIERQTGNILLLAGMQAGTTKVVGTLDASAPAARNPNGGDGGLVETSGAHVKVASTARVTTAGSGNTGNSGIWLVDPFDFTIAASGGDISGATLSSSLANGNVTLQSSGGSNTGSGDIYVNDAVSWNTNRLTLTAARDININAVMTAAGTSSLTMNTGTANGADAGVAGGAVRVGFDAEGNFRGRVDFGTRAGTGFLTINGKAYTVINSLGAAGSTTAADLQGMNGNLAGNYALGANIDATPTSGWNGGAGYLPVGDSSVHFSGSLIGLGHSIDGLTINRPAGGLIGLIGWSDGGGISSLGLKNVRITGLDAVGALAGRNSQSIINSFATGSVNGDFDGRIVGGLIGFNEGAIDASYSKSAVTIDGGSNSYGVGGLVGQNAGTISRSNATGSVTGYASSVGGLAGTSVGAIANSYATGNINSEDLVRPTAPLRSGGTGGLVGNNVGRITGSFATGNIRTGNAASVGGLVGDHAFFDISDSFATGNVTTGSDSMGVGGLVGRMGFGTFSNVYATGTVTVGDRGGNIGGLMGESASGTVVNAHAYGDVIGGASTISMGGLIGSNRSVIIGSRATGSVTAGNSSRNLGGFLGSNGENCLCAVTPLIVADSHATGRVRGGSDSYNLGGLVGLQFFGSVTNSFALGTVSAQFNSFSLGGLIGENAGTVRLAWASGNVSIGNYSPITATALGGLVGYNKSSGTLEQAFASGSVAGIGNAIALGGLVGFNDGAIVSTYSTSSIGGGTFLGGLVGVNRGSISTSYSSGTVTGILPMGGLA